MKKEERAVKPQEKPDWPALGARFILGAVILASGFLKLLEPPQEFAAAIEAYRAIPPALILPLAQAVPWVELFAGGFLLSGYCLSLAAGLAGILNSVFFLALASTKLRGIAIGECGCFGGAGPHLAASQAMLLDIFLITLAGFILKTKPSFFSLDRWITKA